MLMLPPAVDYFHMYHLVGGLDMVLSALRSPIAGTVGRCRLLWFAAFIATTFINRLHDVG